MPRESFISDGTKAVVETTVHSSIREQNGSSARLYGRVIAIAMTENDPIFSKTSVLESIQFEPYRDISLFAESGDTSKQYLVAFKLHSGIKTPVINEIVELVPGPTPLIQNPSTQYSETFYYKDPVSIYGSVEHNAAPDQNTIQNLVPGSSKQTVYDNASIGILNTGVSSETVISSQKISLGNYFQEKGIKPLTPLEGDVKHEGRFGNSLRFGGTPSDKITGGLEWSGPTGDPITILRNGQKQIDQKNNWNSVAEDINKDGSSVYMLSTQQINFILSNNNFDSYNQTNDNSSKQSVVVGTQEALPNNVAASSLDIIAPKDNPTPPVSPSAVEAAPDISDNLDAVPDNESDLNFVQLGEEIPVPLTNGLLLTPQLQGLPSQDYVGDTNNTLANNDSITSGKHLSFKYTSNIQKNAGRVANVPGINNQGRALLDLIALTEETMGQGNFNGYDITYGWHLIKGFNMADSNPPHPHPRFIVGDHTTSASGRYQFQYGTWNSLLKLTKETGMRKFAQDYVGWLDITNKRGKSADVVAAIDGNLDNFSRLIYSLSGEWASLPRKGKKSRFTIDQLWDLYNQILDIYKGK
jgi:muramidase (phage lysozyme)